MGLNLYDRSGDEITMDQFAQLLGEPEYKIVARDTLEDDEETTISTVWLGIDHQFGDGPPLIFETMIFGGEYDAYQWRYSTEEEALEGHERIVLALAVGEAP